VGALCEEDKRRRSARRQAGTAELTAPVGNAAAPAEGSRRQPMAAPRDTFRD